MKKLFLEDSIYPKLNPVFMDNVEIHLPSKIKKLMDAFSNSELASLKDELLKKDPIKPNKDIVGEKYSEMSFEQRNSLFKSGKLKVTGNKIFVTGGQVRNYLLSHFHQITHTSKDWNLATDASPDAIPLIIKFSKMYGKLPHDVQLKEVEGKYWKFEIKYGSDHYSIFSFPFVDYKDAPRMYLQSLEHNFTANSLFYSEEEKRIYDFHGGINDIRNKIAKPVGNLKKIKDKGVYPLMLINLQAMMDDNVKIEGELEKETLNFNIESSDKKLVHAEFIDGIKKAKNIENYIKKLDSCEILQKMFAPLKVNSHININKNNNFIVVIAEILRNNYNDTHVLQETLHEMGYSNTQIHSIIFLVKLPHYSDQNSFDHDKKLINISNKTVEDYIKHKNFHNKKLVKSFMNEVKPLDLLKPEEKINPIKPQNDFNKLSKIVNSQPDQNL